MRVLSAPVVYGDASVSRTSTGLYTVTLRPNTGGSLYKIKSATGNYHVGYNPQDLGLYCLGIAYDDAANANMSTQTLYLSLKDSTGTLTDNPTTNGSAASIRNFGIDLHIVLETDNGTII